MCGEDDAGTSTPPSMKDRDEEEAAAPIFINGTRTPPDI